MVRKQPNTKQKKPAGRGASAGPASTSPNEPPSTTDDVVAPQEQQLSIPHQQQLLDYFAAAFAPTLAMPSLPAQLQAIKQALYQRDFAAAFGRADQLAAYAARWSPTRALCYAGIFQNHLTPPSARTKMICVGGCAAEHVAFASYLGDGGNGDLTLIDAAPWEEVAETLQEALVAPLPLSKYASAAAREANVPLLDAPERLRLRVLQQDALQLTDTQWAELLTPSGNDTTVVVTLLFTLNELYTSGGVAATTRFLAALAAVLPDGALLLVVDSPGSYSEAAIGKESKRYPMQWLLHHTLTEQPGAAAPRRWTRLKSYDSVWFRLSDQLTYPIQLENMRYQLHLYRIDKTPWT